MGGSAFIFASAASTIPIGVLWRRSNSWRTEFSGAPSVGQPDLGPATLTHRLVNCQFRGDQRGEHGSIAAATWRGRSRDRPACLHVPFERRDDAIDRLGGGLLLDFAFGQCFRDSRKTHQPPAVLLPLERVFIADGHTHSSGSLLVNPS
jgi:hypothetical protein